MNLFSYGTLCDPAVLRRITGRIPAATPAVLPDYSAYHLQGRSYPAVVKRPGEVTPGMLYIGLSPREFRCLDRYEGGEYQRQRLFVQISASPMPVSVWVYVLHPGRRALLSRRQWRGPQRHGICQGAGNWLLNQHTQDNALTL